MRNFFNWWLTGLCYLLPDPLIRRVRYFPDRLVITPGPGFFHLNLYKDDNTTPSAKWSVDRLSPPDHTGVADPLASLNPDTVIILVLPRYMVLAKLLTLPATATRNMREILRFEMDRQTPFTHDKVYFDWQEIKKDNDNVIIELFIVLKSVLDPLLEELKQNNIEPHEITPDKTPLVNILPAERRTKAENPEQRIVRRLAVVAACLLLVALYLPILRHGTILSDAEAEVNSLREQASEIQQLIDQRDQMLARIEFLNRKRQEETAVIDILHELTVKLPDDTSLDRLMLQGNELLFYGESTAAASLIQILEDSDYLSNVQFKAPVTKDSQTGKDQFQISAIVGGTGA